MPSYRLEGWDSPQKPLAFNREIHSSLWNSLDWVIKLRPSSGIEAPLPVTSIGRSFLYPTAHHTPLLLHLHLPCSLLQIVSLHSNSLNPIRSSRASQSHHQQQLNPSIAMSAQDYYGGGGGGGYPQQPQPVCCQAHSPKLDRNC